jgi:hypothetical protein
MGRKSTYYSGPVTYRKSEYFLPLWRHFLERYHFTLILISFSSFSLTAKLHWNWLSTFSTLAANLGYPIWVAQMPRSAFVCLTTLTSLEVLLTVSLPNKWARSMYLDLWDRLPTLTRPNSHKQSQRLETYQWCWEQRRSFFFSHSLYYFSFSFLPVTHSFLGVISSGSFSIHLHTHMHTYILYDFPLKDHFGCYILMPLNNALINSHVISSFCTCVRMFLKKFFIIHLFTCMYIVWVISSSSPPHKILLC